MSANYIPLTGYENLSEGQMQSRAEAVLETLSKRRTIRDFSNKPVPRALIETCIRAAGTAPSGANHQPWYFVAISDSCLLYTSPSPRDQRGSRMPSSA